VVCTSVSLCEFFIAVKTFAATSHCNPITNSTVLIFKGGLFGFFSTLFKTVSEDAGFAPRTVATSELAVRRLTSRLKI